VHRPGAATPNRALWEKGDFTRIADTMRQSGEELVERLGVTPGMRVLDLGCGDGTTAIPAAQRGADVLGVDIATNLVAAAGDERGRSGSRLRASKPAMPAICRGSRRLVRRGAHVLRAMFAPDPVKVAAEMVRVTRPGGRVVMANWIPGDPRSSRRSCGSARRTHHRHPTL